MKETKEITHPKASAVSIFHFHGSLLFLRYIKYKDNYIHKVVTRVSCVFQIIYVIKFCYVYPVCHSFDLLGI